MNNIYAYIDNGRLGHWAFHGTIFIWWLHRVFNREEIIVLINPLKMMM